MFNVLINSEYAHFPEQIPFGSEYYSLYTTEQVNIFPHSRDRVYTGLSIILPDTTVAVASIHPTLLGEVPWLVKPEFIHEVAWFQPGQYYDIFVTLVNPTDLPIEIDAGSLIGEIKFLDLGIFLELPPPERELLRTERGG